jgi:formylglycine-generating enzyme required for sulfatase activity
MSSLLSPRKSRTSAIIALFLAVLIALAGGRLMPRAPAADKPTASAEPKSGVPNPDELEKMAEAKTKLLARPTPEWMPKPVLDIPAAKAADAAGMKAYVEQIPGTDVKFKMAPIPGGKFTMGSPAGEKRRAADEGPQHEVAIEPFWMEEHEVTWTEYELWGLNLDKQRRKIKKAPSTARDEVVDAVAVPTNPYEEMSFGMGKDNGMPAICMTQFAAKVYCRWLSAKTGRYYRLPTEAEWEYACRAGTKTAYSFGNDASKLGDYAWFTDNSDDHYHRVATKKPNPWGLYDMHGNVAEWCIDQYSADFYTRGAGKLTKEPLCPNTKEYGRIVRGGSWDDDADKCRSATRRASEKEWKKQDPQIPQSIWYLTDARFVGFRVVRPLRVPTPEEAKKYEVDEDQLEAYKDYMIAQANKQ